MTWDSGGRHNVVLCFHLFKFRFICWASSVLIQRDLLVKKYLYVLTFSRMPAPWLSPSFCASLTSPSLLSLSHQHIKITLKNNPSFKKKWCHKPFSDCSVPYFLSLKIFLKALADFVVCASSSLTLSLAHSNGFHLHRTSEGLLSGSTVLYLHLIWFLNCTWCGRPVLPSWGMFFSRLLCYTFIWAFPTLLVIPHQATLPPPLPLPLASSSLCPNSLPKPLYPVLGALLDGAEIIHFCPCRKLWWPVPV